MVVLSQGDLEWITHIGDRGVAVALMIVLIVMAGAIVLVVRMWRDVRLAQIQMERDDRDARRKLEAEQTRERLEIERDRVKAEDKQAAIMDRLELTLTGTQTAISRLLELVGTTPTKADLQAAGATMREWAVAHDQRLDRVHEDIKAVPGEVWRLGDPRLGGLTSGIRAGLEPLIADLQETVETGFRRIETGLAERLEALGEEVSPALRGMLNQELAQYQQRTQRQLENIKLLVEALRDDLAREGRDDRASSRGIMAGVTHGTPDSGETTTPTHKTTTQNEENTS